MNREARHTAFIVFASVTLITCPPAQASHNSEFEDFNSGVTGAFANCTVSEGVCVGRSPTQPISYNGIDTLPARNAVTGMIDASSRLVLLTFDIVNPFASLVAGSFEITATNHYHFPSPIYEPMTISSTVFSDSVQFFLGRESHSISFVYDGIAGAAQGLGLKFSFASFATQGTWGLDNVRIDWGQPVPEPAAFGMILTATLTCLSVVRVRKGFLTRRIPA